MCLLNKKELKHAFHIMYLSSDTCDAEEILWETWYSDAKLKYLQKKWNRQGYIYESIFVEGKYIGDLVY